jgi:hypothetical protein
MGKERNTKTLASIELGKLEEVAPVVASTRVVGTILASAEHDVHSAIKARLANLDIDIICMQGDFTKDSRTSNARTNLIGARIKLQNLHRILLEELTSSHVKLGLGNGIVTIAEGIHGIGDGSCAFDESGHIVSFGV